jgi:hypothetical protein
MSSSQAAVVSGWGLGATKPESNHDNQNNQGTSEGPSPRLLYAPSSSSLVLLFILDDDSGGLGDVYR